MAATVASYVRSGGEGMSEVLQVREWDADLFHKKVLQLEAEGFVSRLETYRIVADMNPDTGIVVHLHSMEMYRPE
jgi:hypothetical protein